MTLQLYGHPFSSHCWKALIALYENDISFDFRMLGPDHPENNAELEARWPLKKFPVLVDGERVIAEATIIIEYLAAHYLGTVALITADADAMMAGGDVAKRAFAAMMTMQKIDVAAIEATVAG